MKKIIILSGGLSPEREVSIVSAQAVKQSLLELGYECQLYDPKEFSSISEMILDIKRQDLHIVFNALHGGDGENGNIQALLEMENIPFTGSGSLASKLAMDKYVSKLIAQDLAIPTAESILVTKGEDYSARIKDISYPVIVKPNSGGSSVGISKVLSVDEVEGAVEEAFQFDNKVLIEDFIAGKELTVTVLGGEAFPVVEIRPIDGWYDYKNKYTSGKTEYICPAELSIAQVDIISNYAVEYYKRLDCKAYARVDFRFDGETFFFLEVNTLPGMTSLSLTPMSAKQAGLNFNSLLKSIIKDSL